MHTHFVPHLRQIMRIALLLLTVSGVEAQVPRLVNYQGRVAVNAVNFEGMGLFKFALVNANGSTTFWSNNLTSVAGSEPTAAVPLAVAKGLYSVLLGDPALANMTSIPPSVFTNPDVRLRVWFNDGVNGSQLLTPDQRLAPAPYLADAAVTAATIADEAIIAAKIAPGTIDGTRVAPGSLDFSHLVVPNAPGAGQLLGFDGASLLWTAPGVGDGIWTLGGTTAYYLGGNVGIRTSTTAKHSLSIGASPAWTSYFWGGAIEFTNASAIGWNANAAGSRFGIGQSTGGLYFFRTASDPGTTGSAAIYDMWVNDLGNVIMTGGGPGLFTVGSPNGESGSSIQRGGNRADVRFEGTSLKLVAGPGNGPPSSLNGITVTTSGNIGMGSPTPQSKLEVVGQDALRLVGYQPFLTLLDNNAGLARSRIQGVGGNITLATESFINGSNGNNYAQLNANGNFSVKSLTIRGGADLAEPFAMSERGVPVGTVVSIDPQHPGKLRMSAAAYDRKVAGIVSGANGITPGISMIDEQQLEAGENVALSGRVYVKANGSAGSIEPGDLLTTSDVPGEAMKATDHQRAQGSILGKAMTSLDETTGLVLVLVTLQ